MLEWGDAVWVAVITGVAGLISGFVSALTNRKMVEYRLQQAERNIARHGKRFEDLLPRMNRVETKVEALEGEASQNRRGQ